ncbi:Cylicin-2, partial [Ophiophagus hannah]
MVLGFLLKEGREGGKIRGRDEGGEGKEGRKEGKGGREGRGGGGRVERKTEEKEKKRKKKEGEEMERKESNEGREERKRDKEGKKEREGGRRRKEGKREEMREEGSKGRKEGREGGRDGWMEEGRKEYARTRKHTHMESHRLERIVKHGGESHTAHETPQKSSGDVMHRTESRGKKITDLVGRIRLKQLRIRRGSELKGGEKEKGRGRKEEEKKEKRSEKRKGGRTEGRGERKRRRDGEREEGRKTKGKEKKERERGKKGERKEGKKETKKGRKEEERGGGILKTPKMNLLLRLHNPPALLGVHLCDCNATTIGGKDGGHPWLSVCMTFSVPKEDTDGPRCWDQKHVNSWPSSWRPKTFINGTREMRNGNDGRMEHLCGASGPPIRDDKLQNPRNFPSKGAIIFRTKYGPFVVSKVGFVILSLFGRAWWEKVWGLTGSCGQILGIDAGHPNLRAALAQDGQLSPPVDTAACQGGMAVFEIHSKITVDFPAPPFSLDFGLHLEGETLRGLQKDLRVEGTALSELLRLTESPPSNRSELGKVCGEEEEKEEVEEEEDDSQEEEEVCGVLDAL